MEIRKNPILKSKLIQANGNELYKAFFLLVETIAEIRRSPILKRYSGKKLIHGRGN